jgi:DNA repair protein RecO (recombination protein O)|tara:strand:+ start:3105 stop:3746 length:642 start_codon:yes stop_codon:yes gene_type:complete
MYQGSSLLLDFFTKSHGRVRLIARGARSSKMSLQMFQCLSISFKGKSDLKSLSQWEILDEPRRLLGDDLILAIYANELLIRLLPEGDEYSELFNAYWLYIKNIKNKSNPEKEYSLRIFENQLLLELGYGLDFKDDIEGTPIKGSVLYDFIEDQGFIAQTEGKILGEILLNIVSPNQVIPNSKGLSALKKLNRKRLKPLLGDKPLKSKELFFIN